MNIVSKILKVCIFLILAISITACGYKQDPYWDIKDKKQSDVLLE